MKRMAGLVVVGWVLIAAACSSATTTRRCEQDSDCWSGARCNQEWKRCEGGTSPNPTSTTQPNQPGNAPTAAPTGTGSSKPSQPSAPPCDTEDDCPYWYFYCASGPPVNTAHCTNDRCETAAVACPKSCAGFGT